MITSRTQVSLFIMSSRGYSILDEILSSFGPEALAYVVTSSDPKVENDYRSEIVDAAHCAGVPVFDRTEKQESLPRVAARFAAGWRWLLPGRDQEPLVIFHDSLLPRYRGFAPLVSALIKGDRKLGVTALLGTASYDAGPILRQEEVDIGYPLRISEAIDAVRPCYANLARTVFNDLRNSSWAPSVQDESKVTYSLWRDDADYLIDWQLDAPTIRRFVDATGSPYSGAATFAIHRKIRVLAATEMPDVRIENRTPGKIIALEEGRPIVVCGQGLLRIDEAVCDVTREAALPWRRLRTRFVQFPAVA
jgi:methionyl-tRNA formyltransferase